MSYQANIVYLPTLDGQTVMWGCEWYQPMTFKFSPLSWEKYLASSMALTKSSDMISTRSFLISQRGGMDSAETDTIVPVLLVIFYNKRFGHVERTNDNVSLLHIIIAHAKNTYLTDEQGGDLFLLSKQRQIVAHQQHFVRYEHFFQLVHFRAHNLAADGRFQLTARTNVHYRSGTRSIDYNDENAQKREKFSRRTSAVPASGRSTDGSRRRIYEPRARNGSIKHTYLPIFRAEPRA